MQDEEILTLIDRFQHGNFKSDEEVGEAYAKLVEAVPGIIDLIDEQTEVVDAKKLLQEAREKQRVFVGGSDGVAATHPFKKP